MHSDEPKPLKTESSHAMILPLIRPSAVHFADEDEAEAPRKVAEGSHRSIPSLAEFPTADIINKAALSPNTEDQVSHGDVLHRTRKGFVEIIVEHHRISFAVTLSVELLSVVLSLVLCFQSNYELFPVEFEFVPMELYEEKSYQRFLAYNMRFRETVAPEVETINLKKRPLSSDILEVIFKGNNVFSKESLKIISEVEQWLTDFSEWKALDENGHDSSHKPLSMLRFLDGSMSPDLNDTDFNNISGTLSDAYSRIEFEDSMNTMISDDAVMSPKGVSSTITRILIHSPLTESTNYSDGKLWEIHFKDKLNDLAKNGRGGMQIYYYNFNMFIHDLFAQVKKDFYLIIGSFVFIFLFMLIQTHSLFLTIAGIGGIFTSFLWTNLFYRVVLDYSYFGIFHVMSVFIILGIGADDIFVFNDTWRISLCMDFPSTHARFRYCFHKAGASMTITSVTTAIAFASNVFTSLFALRTYALFSAILVMFNYLSAVLFFPFCVLINHKDIQPFYKSLTARIFAQSRKESIETVYEPDMFVKFFRTFFYKLVTHSIMRWVFIIFFTLQALFLGYKAYQLEMSDRELQFYKWGHNYQEAQELRGFSFKRRLRNDRIKVVIVFGLKEQDMSKCGKSEYKCVGNFSYDDSLDLNPTEAQTKLLDFCKDLYNMDPDKDLHLDKVNNKSVMKCFLLNMNSFFLSHSFVISTDGHVVNLEIPITGLKFAELAILKPNIYRNNVVDGNFYRFFETAVMYWLTNGYTGDWATGNGYTEDVHFSEYLGLSRGSRDITNINGTMDFYGHRLRFFIIELMTNLSLGYVNYKTGLAAFNAWENFTQVYMKKLPRSVQGFQLAKNNEWHTFQMSANLQQNLERGIILGVIVSFIVMTLATSNVIISTVATINILFVVTAFGGCLKLLGWSISVIESLNLSLVTGLAVDYVVHLSESYHYAPHETRMLKVRDMLEHMGLSVLSGAITTAGAAAFMVFAEIYFFYQFGVFIVMTVSFSLLYSFFWFTPLLSVIGPEKNMGSLVPFYKWLWRKLDVLVDNILSEEIRRLSHSRSISFFDETEEKQTNVASGEQTSI